MYSIIIILFIVFVTFITYDYIYMITWMAIYFFLRHLFKTMYSIKICISELSIDLTLHHETKTAPIIKIM